MIALSKKERVKRLHTSYKGFMQNMKNIWEEYSYLEQTIKAAKPKEFELKSMYSPSVTKKKKTDAGGMQNKFLTGENAKSHYITAIGLFEKYISTLAANVYFDCPRKMSSAGMDSDKLFDLIIDCDEKDEMIDRIIEEKLRSIFYGNPVDVFKKDKCKLELKNVFSEKYPDSLKFYSEIVGRRNAIVHNDGRVDKKFLRENPGTAYKEKQKIIITEDYLRGAIGLMLGIAAVTTSCVVENIYGETTQGKLKSIFDSFERCNKTGWYNKLLI